jgi:uncharacterized oxidoreductase
MIVPHTKLRDIALTLLRAGGSSEAEADTVADHLIGANLSGHDSHGVVMLSPYVKSLKNGNLKPNHRHSVVSENGNFAVWDGKHCYGQVVAREAMQWCIDTAKAHGVAIHGLRNVHHIGRVGTYGEMAAAAGLVSISFVNGYSGKPRVAPFRGKHGRYTTNPICIAVPGTATTKPVILDFATSVIALGKVRVAYNDKRPVVAGALIDHEGRPTTNPGVMYEEPIGAALPFGEHKGSGLALICDLLAGAVAGAGVMPGETPPDHGIVNGWLTIVLDPARLAAMPFVQAEIDKMVAFVKSSPPIDPELPVLVAGEPERIARAKRSAEGVYVDDETWAQLVEAGRSLGVNIDLAA